MAKKALLVWGVIGHLQRCIVRRSLWASNAMRMAPCTSLAQLVAVVALATPALGLLDWNQMTVRQQVQTLITPGAATTAAPPAPRQPQAVESASAVLARDQKPGSTVIESSCRHGENDRSAITGTINCAVPHTCVAATCVAVSGLRAVAAALTVDRCCEQAARSRSPGARATTTAAATLT